MSLNNLKTNIKGIKNEVKHFGKKKEFDSEHELIAHYKHDLHVAIKALNYIAKQLNKQYKNYWVKYFGITLRVAVSYMNLMGWNSLQFENIDELNKAIDEEILEGRYDKIHPKEKNETSDSLNSELYGYFSILNQLRFDTLNEWEYIAGHLEFKIQEMNKYLKHFLKMIKERDLKKIECDDISLKLKKMKKSSSLDTSTSNEIKRVEEKEAKMNNMFDKINNKLVQLLPQGFLLLEEFVDSLTKYVLCHQHESFKNIFEKLNDFYIYHGYGEGEDLQNSSSNFEELESKLNSFSKYRSESTGEDKSREALSFVTQKGSNMMAKILSQTSKLKTKIEPHDHTNGLFNGYMAADPLDYFERLKNPQYNKAQVYFKRRINASELQVPDVQTEYRPLPPLPPRSNTATVSVVPSPSYERQSMVASLTPASEFTSDNLFSYDLDTNDTMSEISLSSVSSDTSDLGESYEKDDYDYVTSKITVFYNIFKNEITQAPIHSPINNYDGRVFKLKSDHDSLSFQLKNIHERLSELSDTDGTTVTQTVKQDFKGQQIGDLSVKTGNKVKVLVDLQKQTISYNNSDKNWSICMLDDHGIPRVGFVPNSCLV